MLKKHDYRWRPTEEPRRDGMIQYRCQNCNDFIILPSDVEPPWGIPCPQAKEDTTHG